MALTKTDFDKLDARIENIVGQPVEQIQVDSALPPTIEQLEDNNKTYSILAAILFIDIRKSTYLTENSQAKSMVKIYRSFMRMAVECVRKNGGVTRQFLGDRIMGVFIDSVDENGNVIESAVDKSINAARSLQTVIMYSLNKHLKSKVNGKIIECGIGIDYGKVLVTKVGMYGVEQDKEKEDEMDCVWVGNTTNYASKFSDLAEGGEIFVSENVYQKLSSCYKENWTNVAKVKGNKVFEGYVIKDYFLDYVDELGEPANAQNSNEFDIEVQNQLVCGIREIERLQNGLINREKEIAILEQKMKEENSRIKQDYHKEFNSRIEIEQKYDELKDELEDAYKQYFDFICKIVGFSHCKSKYVESVKKEDWFEIIERAYDIGKKLGYSEEYINSRMSCGLIAIYRFYGEYEKAYEAIVIMAKTNSVWINMEVDVLKWAKDNYVLHRLQNAVEKRLVNYEIDYDKRSTFEDALKKIKQLRGV
ncbi:MAG: adenylate/guanylate cyclase domain-containing protein [Clostridia bacterium]|nr:adenylate/guanylate cyclase domain-containing protein [Clostridia bacterium]